MIQMEVPDWLEGMHYGGPVYRQSDGAILCGFTTQKHNLTFYVGRVPEELCETLTRAGFSLRKGAVRFTKLDPEKLQLLHILLCEMISTSITC